MYQVSIDNISKSFGSTRVLDNVSLRIEAGEMFFLLGPSGCGKTTLLRILAGFERPDSGTVLFDGRDTSSLPPQKRATSLVFQNYALWPHMTIAENIAFGLENKHLGAAEIRKRTGEALDLVRMGGFERRMPGQLSGGQQQRIALARALVVNPNLLLLDEPLSNLDARLRAEMRAELARLHRATAITTVYVTHDQGEALCLADRIAFMDQRRIVQVGTPRQLYEEPVSADAARFLGNANLVAGSVAAVESACVTVQTRLGVLRCGPAAGGAELHPGDAVTCFFRPERMVAAPGGTICGTVTDGLYLGSSEHLYLEENGVAFQAQIPAPATPTRIGARCSFDIAPGNIRLLTT